jgi:hypothetical protein
VKNKDNNNTKNNSATPNKFKITFLIAIFGMILITATLTLNIKAVVFAQNNSTNLSQSVNQTGTDQYLCKLPPQEQIRILHGQHLSGC